MNSRYLFLFAIFMFLMMAVPTVVHSEEVDTSDEIALLTALEEQEEAPRDLDRSKMTITGFVDFGWIYPNFLADTEKNLERVGRNNADHHWGTESGNAQSTVSKLEARTFIVNEINFDFNVSYNDYISSKASVFIYPTTRTNTSLAWSSLSRDQDIPRDAGGDETFGTEDDIIGEDTAVDPGDGLNRVVVGIKQAYIDFAYPGNFNAFLRIGKMPSLLGIEQEVFQAPDLATVASSTIGGFSYGYPQGIQLLGALSLRTDDDLEFGFGLTHDANNLYNIFPSDVTGNRPFALANDNLVLAGRLAFSQGTRNAFTVGVSGQTGKKGRKEVSNDGRFSSFHPFVKLRLDPSDNPNIGPFRIRAEGLIMDIDNRIGSHENRSNRARTKYDFVYRPQIEMHPKDPNQDGDVRHKGFSVYLHVDLLKELLTLTFGYSRVESEVLESVDPALHAHNIWGTRRTQLAARYRIHKDVIIKAEFQVNREDGTEAEVDNNLITTSLVYSF